MRKVLPFLFMMFFGSSLFADLDKHQKYGTTPEEYEPVPVFINPDYLDTYRNEVTITVGGGSWDSEISWQLDTDPAGDTPVASGGAPFSETVTLPDGMYLLTAYDSFNDGWNGASFTITDNVSGEVLFTYAGPPSQGSGEVTSFEIGGGVPGCMDATACNFNASATEDDGSCCLTNCGDLTVAGGSYQSEVSWEIYSMTADNLTGDLLYTGGAPADGEVCLEDGDYMVKGYDSWGDGWNGNSLTIVNPEGQIVVDFTFDGTAGPCNNPNSNSTDDLGECDSTYFSVPLDPPVNQLVLAAILDLDPGAIVNPDTTADPADGDAAFFSSSDGKAVVVQAMEDIGSLANYGLGNATNGGGTDGVEFTFPDVSLAAGELLWVARTPAAMLAYFGDDFTGSFVDPTLDGVSSAANGNGNDAVELFFDGVAVDVYGEITHDYGTDYASIPWSYRDSWGVRSIGTTLAPIVRTPSTTFNLADWETGGDDCTSDSDSNPESPTNLESPCPMPHLTEPAFACDLTPVTINLNDSYGDGWNGNTLDIANGFVVLTLNADDGPCDNGATSSTSEDLGECATHDACLPDGLHLVTCDGGSWQAEVTWEILAEDGTVLLAGGAPYEGYLNINASAGCTDPTAVNYDETAELDDGSCYYEGDQCDVALTAVLGENTSDGETEWFKYTATMDGILTVTSQNETGDAEWDTNLSLHDGDCASLELLGANDDCCGYWGPSTVEIDIVAGEMYTILWTNSYNPGPFTWHLEESPPPTNPQNFTATGGVLRAYLEWEGILPVLNGSSNGSGNVNIANNIEAQSHLEIEQAYAQQKKSMIYTDSGPSTRVGGRVHPDYVPNSRTTPVTIECDGGTWQAEISWTVDYAGADGVFGTEDDVASIVSGLSPAGTTDETTGEYTPLTADFDDGLYMLNAFDSYGDGWNGNFFTVYSETMTYINWTLGTGGSGMVEFTVSSDPANLTLSNLTYDQSTDELSVDITNSGGLLAWDVAIGYHLATEVSGDCQAPADFAFWGPNVAAGETITFPLVPSLTSVGLSVTDILGYGTFDIGASVDWLCLVPESNEEDNTTATTVTLVDPLDDISFNVYRADNDPVAGTVGEFALIGSEVVAEQYMDFLVAGDYVWYVTQVTAGVESDSSNWAYATVFGTDDFPEPTDLMVEGNDYDAMLMWTAPDLTGWEPPMTSNFNPGPSDMKQHGTEQTSVIPPTLRQGGDTFETATAIEEFPYENTGTTVGYVADYGPYDALVDPDGDGINDTYCEYVGWLGSTGAAADVVYSMSLAEMSSVSVTTCGSQEAFPDTYYDTALGIFTMEDDGTGTMVPVLVAANDDFCGDGYQAEINCELPAGDYYIVVSGYSTNEGDYHIAVTNLDDVPPVAGYYVYRDGEVVGTSVGMESTSYEDLDLEDPDNPGGSVTHTYNVSAYYMDWDMESALSNPAEVTLPVLNCYSPPGLAAETQSNNVHLAWEQVPGQGGAFGHHNGELFTGIGAGAADWECGVLFGPEDLEDVDGMVMDMVSFIPQDLSESFKVFVYDPVTGLPVDSTELIDGASLVLGQWHDVMLPNPVLIDASQSLMFGYRVVGLDGTFPSGADSGPAYQGFGDLIKGFGTDWSSMAELYGLDYNWMLEGHATFGPGRSVSDMATNEVSISIGNGSSLSSRDLVEPVTVTRPADRSLLGYNVHRGDHHVGTTGPGTLMFLDDWVPWGDYTYHVTALYDHGIEGACSESVPASVEVSLMNSAPNAFDLVQPTDGSVVEVTPESIEGGMMINFVWQSPNDPDNDVVHFNPHIVGHSDGDTLVEMEAPMMAQPNPSFEDNAGTDAPLAPWGTWPPENTNFSFESNGNGIYGSDATLTVFDGEHCLKVWGQYGETMPNVTPVYQGHSIEAMGLEPGDAVAIAGHMMSHADDWVGQGANRAYLFISFFDANWTFLGSSLSHMMDRTMPPSEWHKFFALAVVPEGAVNMNAGVEYHQESGGDHGSVYFDDINMFVPVTSSIMQASHEDLVMAAMNDGVHHVTVDWNVGAMDVWDMTMASNGPFQFTLDLSATLGIDESTIPDVFALHNNYPNPFNPVTNITYDIPEVADVKLEIYNVMGQKIRTLATGSHEPGRYRVLWNATNDLGQGLSSGMYIYRIQAGDFVSVKKLVLMK